MAGGTRCSAVRKKQAIRGKDVGEVTKTVADEKPLRPAQCRAYMRKTLAEEFRGIVDGFVKGAKSGSCQHVKLATELLESQKKAKRGRSGQRTVSRWLDEMERGV